MFFLCSFFLHFSNPIFSVILINWTKVMSTTTMTWRSHWPKNIWVYLLCLMPAIWLCTMSQTDSRSWHICHNTINDLLHRVSTHSYFKLEKKNINNTEMPLTNRQFQECSYIIIIIQGDPKNDRHSIMHGTLPLCISV